MSGPLLPSKRHSGPKPTKPKSVPRPRRSWDRDVSDETKREIVRLAQIEDPIPEWPQCVMRRYRHSELAEKFGVSESVVDNVVKEASR